MCSSNGMLVNADPSRETVNLVLTARSNTAALCFLVHFVRACVSLQVEPRGLQVLYCGHYK